MNKILLTDYNKILLTLFKERCNICPGCHRNYYCTTKCIVTRELMRNNNLTLQDIEELRNLEYNEIIEELK